MNSRASRDELLQPSLSDGSLAAVAPYSARTVLFSAFFGGPVAALLMFATNSYRLRRLAKDLPVFLLCTALFVSSAWLVYRSSAAQQIHEWIRQIIGRPDVQFPLTLEALIIAGSGFLMHRQGQRNSDLMGLKRPNGWVGGLACLVLGIGLQIVVIIVFKNA